MFLHDVDCLWWLGPVYPEAGSVGRTFPVKHSTLFNTKYWHFNVAARYGDVPFALTSRARIFRLPAATCCISVQSHRVPLSRSRLLLTSHDCFPNGKTVAVLSAHFGKTPLEISRTTEASEFPRSFCWCSFVFLCAFVFFWPGEGFFFRTVLRQRSWTPMLPKIVELHIVINNSRGFWCCVPQRVILHLRQTDK